MHAFMASGILITMQMKFSNINMNKPSTNNPTISNSEATTS